MTTRARRVNAPRPMVLPAGALPPGGEAPAQPTEEEAFRTLCELAHGRTGRLSVETLARHALGVARGGGWPVARAALEAILRRVALHAQDDLRVSARPAGGRRLGVYATRRGSGDPRPYRVRLRSTEPLDGSCDCDDFLRNSLGLCKHLVAVLLDLAGRREAPADAARRAEEEGEGGSLRWDPVRPLTGPGDWLEGLRWRAPRAPRRSWPRAVRAADAWFEDPGGPDGARALRRTDLAPGPRAALVAALDAVVTPAAHERLAFDADPAVRPLLAAERVRLAPREAWPRRRQAWLSHLRSLKQRLYPYQREGVERFLSCGSLLLADDMGLGKTAQAIASCHALFRAGEVRRGLLVVPASLKPQWLREWHAFTDAPCSVVDGDAPARARAYRQARQGFLVANYEQVLRDLPAMHAWRPDVVVLDEAQRIKNWATKTASFVKRLEPRWRLVLTGTPMENRLEELSSLLDWVDDRAVEPIWRLSPWHAATGDGTAEVRGARHLDTLRARLSGCMLRRVRREVLSQLPPRTDTQVPVPLTEEQRAEHDDLIPSIAALAAKAKRRPLSQAEFLRLMQLLTTQRVIANGIAQLRFEDRWPELSRVTRPDEGLLRSLASPKLAELREILAQVVVGQGRKAVVFSQWRRMLTLAHWATQDLLGDAGLRAAFFTGAEGARQRTRNLVEFHDDPALRVLFATDAGGVGLNLQRAANCCVNLELPWNPAVLEQRIGRIHRLGQSKPIDVYALVSEESIESHIADIVGDKRALFTGLFDGTSDEVRFDRCGSFLTRLDRVLARATPPAPSTPPAEPAPDAPEAVEGVLASADESRDAAPQPSIAAEARDAPARAPHAAEVRRLFSRLTIRPTAEGGVRIDAPADAAAALAALFEGMAGLLRAERTDVPGAPAPRPRAGSAGRRPAGAA